ncbi:MAG: RNA 3'-terminal phosphate cyclase [Candidatus Thermoplasmatota archaeon]|nr:RNA 3'-terminal phosphate cyclase [Candidatus Thermoplasmatota archaeon]
MPEVTIDGSHGEGGGQVLRTAAGLAARTGTSLHVTNIRANRSRPGLRPQHVAALEAVAQACQGELSGCEVGAREISLSPGDLRADRVEVDTGTAANTLLVLQALIALAPGLSGPLELVARGGTDTLWAPTVGHTRDVLSPLARRAGVDIEILEVQHGFYPEGGGVLRARLTPREPARSLLPDTGRGGLEEVAVETRVAGLPAHVGERVSRSTVERLEAAGLTVEGTVHRVAAACPGVVVDAVARYEHTVLGANQVGRRGRPSEAVGEACGDALLEEIEGPGWVDVHTADQLVPLVFGRPSCKLLVREVTGHLATNLHVADRFLDGGYEVMPAGSGWWVRFTAGT